MKNLIIIISVVILFFLLVAGVFFAGFKLYFSPERNIERTRKFMRVMFQRDSSGASISISPLGVITVENFRLASRGGFGSGKQFGIKKLTAKINPLKALKREIEIDRIDIDGFELDLSYKDNEKFNYGGFFENSKLLIFDKTTKTGYLKDISFSRICARGGTIKIKSKYGLLEFDKIDIDANVDRVTGNVSGTLSFEMSGAFTARTDFVYDASQKVIRISRLVCDDLGLSAEGRIELLKNGEITCDITAKIAKDKLPFFALKLLGNPAHQDSADSADDIIMRYSFD